MRNFSKNSQTTFRRGLNIENEVNVILNLPGVSIFYDKALGRDIQLSELSRDYRAVILACGLWETPKFDFPVPDTENISYGLYWLKALNENKITDLRGRKVLIIGGGESALDIARNVKALGGYVTVIYLEIKQKHKEYLEQKLKIVSHFKLVPQKITQVGKNFEIKCVNPTDKTMSARVLNADRIILSIGQFNNPKQFDAVESDSQGVKTDGTLRIKENIFAAGDIIKDGQRDIISAIAMGKKAGNIVSEYLGDHNKEYSPKSKAVPNIHSVSQSISKNIAVYDKSCNIFIGQVGGQGGVSTLKILGQVFSGQGWDYKSFEIKGMAQRGGSVYLHFKASRKEKVLSPLIAEETADIGLFFEPLEALRNQHMIKDDGIILINSVPIPPPIVMTKMMEYPEDPVEEIRRLSPNLKITEIDIDKEVKLSQATGVFILGVLSHYFDFEMETWRKSIKHNVPQNFIKENMEAFEKGTLQ